MKKKFNKLKSLLNLKQEIGQTDQVLSEQCQDAYYQINQKSFKQNFKMLIGHFQTCQNQSSLGK